jgi:hypothetical protein
LEIFPKANFWGVRNKENLQDFLLENERWKYAESHMKEKENVRKSFLYFSQGSSRKKWHMDKNNQRMCLNGNIYKYVCRISKPMTENSCHSWL